MKLDLADVKPSLFSWVMIGLMAISFIVVAKYLVTRWPIPGVTEIVNAA